MPSPPAICNWNCVEANPATACDCAGCAGIQHGRFHVPVLDLDTLSPAEAQAVIDRFLGLNERRLATRDGSER